MDRVHRLGQQQDVHIYRYSVADSIEERMLALQEQKRDLMKASCCRLGGAGRWEEGFECGGNKGADAAQALAGHCRLRCRPPACREAFRHVAFPAGQLPSSTTLHVCGCRWPSTAASLMRCAPCALTMCGRSWSWRCERR